MRWTIMLLIMLISSMALPILKIWEFKAGDQINDIAIGGKEVGIASHCSYILDLERGSVLAQNCTSEANAVSYSQGTFVFVTSDGKALVYNGTLTPLTVDISTDYSNAVRAINSTAFVACYTSCGMFTTSGKLLWNISNLTVLTDPVVIDDFLIIANSLNNVLLELDDGGKVIGQIPMNSNPWAIASCGNYIGVKTSDSFYLYDINGTLLWEVNGLRPYGGVAFSPLCKIVVIGEGTTLHAISLEYGKKEIFEMSYPLGISDVAWNNDTLLVGFFDGTVYAYKVNSQELLNASSLISSEMGAPGTPAPVLLSLFFPMIRRFNKINLKIRRRKRTPGTTK